jgi:phytoene/squalene synthetase
MTPRELREWSGESHCLAMMNQQIQRAQRYYDQSAGLDEMITSSCRPTLWAMTSIYHGLLQKMQRDPSRVVLTKRLRLSALHKGAIAVRAKWQARSARNGHLDDRSASLSRAVSGNSTAQ